MVLFTLVAGFLPFEDPNTSALYKKILSGSYEKPRWLSGGKEWLQGRGSLNAQTEYEQAMAIIVGEVG